MRFGNLRGIPLALSMTVVLASGLVSSVRADGWRLQNTIPREVPAYDFTTGGEYYAPPIPYGHYAKDDLGKAIGCMNGLGSQALGLFHQCCEKCKNGLHCGHNNGTDCGLGHGCGHGGSSGNCGFCAGRGLFHHHGDGALGSCGMGAGCGTSAELAGCNAGSSLVADPGHKKHFAPCHASTVAATSQVQPTAPVVAASGQSLCGDPGCNIAGRHSHPGHFLCRLCHGSGCGACGGAGMGDPCNACGGLGHGHGNGMCGACGGCGLFHHGLGHGGKSCGFCGGKGCEHCMKGLGHGRLMGSLLGLMHRKDFDYFVGPGGPVPLTPGYVPYIVVTRSPREFFAFPPMNPNDP